jgi:hypothetical protein
LATGRTGTEGGRAGERTCRNAERSRRMSERLRVCVFRSSSGPGNQDRAGRPSLDLPRADHLEFGDSGRRTLSSRGLPGLRRFSEWSQRGVAI